MALMGSFLAGLAAVGLLRRVHLALPSGGVSNELGTIPLSPVEIGKLHDRGPLATRVIAVAGRFGLDPALVMAVIEVESGRDPTALSPKGAVGLMQVMPETAALFGFPEPADPASNLAAGCRYLATLLDSFGGDVELALAAYNAGPGAVRRWGTIPPYRETREFVQRVAAAYRRLTGADLLTTERVGEGSSTLF